MRVKADLDLCQGHAVCQMEAPEIFRVRDGRITDVWNPPPMAGHWG